MPKVRQKTLREIEQALQLYSDEVEQTGLRPDNKSTSLLHARAFVRWRADDSTPGGHLRQRQISRRSPWTSSMSERGVAYAEADAVAGTVSAGSRVKAAAKHTLRSRLSASGAPGGTESANHNLCTRGRSRRLSGATRPLQRSFFGVGQRLWFRCHHGCCLAPTLDLNAPGWIDRGSGGTRRASNSANSGTACLPTRGDSLARAPARGTSTLAGSTTESDTVRWAAKRRSRQT